MNMAQQTAQRTLAGTAVEIAPKHVLGIADVADAMTDILAHATRLKQTAASGAPLPRLLDGKTVLLLFEKNSTRTRVSFEVGVQRLGGIVSTLDSGTSQLARGESLQDTASVLSRYGDAIVYRAKDHDSVLQTAKHATVPVINSLTDLEHPCQILADWQTLVEHWGDAAGKTFAYVGDGNNMCHSYLLGAPLLGMDIRVATPSQYAPDPQIIEQAQDLAALAGTQVVITTDAVEAVQGADAVATDTWISMGDEEEAAARLAAFEGFCVDAGLMAHAAADAVFLHCLPGHWGEEATTAVAHGPQSLIYDQAENRMWAQMALLVHLLAPTKPAAPAA